MIASAVSTSASTTKENPYEHWIEPNQLTTCSIQFQVQTLYKKSDGDEINGTVILFLSFDKGAWNSATHTFTAKKEKKETDYSSLQKCKIIFDPGANKIESFELFMKKKFRDISANMIEVNGLELLRTYPQVRDVTFFPLDGAKTCNSLKSVKQEITFIDNKRNKTTLSLVKYNCDNYSLIYIAFDGCLPKLPAYEGKCSWFGGKNDTGIDVTLRTEFYNTNLGKFGSNTLMNYREFYEIEKVREEFDKWMNRRADFYGNWKEARWEGTGLDCGPARNLDTENDYYCAMRWHNKTTERYGDEGKPGHQHWWRKQRIKVTNGNQSVVVRPVDWGPHGRTDRVIDVSKKTLDVLGVRTDDWVKICFADPNAPLGLVTNQ